MVFGVVLSRVDQPDDMAIIVAWLASEDGQLCLMPVWSSQHRSQMGKEDGLPLAFGPRASPGSNGPITADGARLAWAD
ncbi:hypothetical protein CWC38_09925 [Kocuria tytonicola]|nr:hypothetical protein CWC38_09925 [Kocuria tytonicola]